jgi:magnesium transporter
VKGRIERPRRKKEVRRQTAPGTSPGTLVADPHAPPPSISVLAYGPDGLEEEQLTQPAQAREMLGRHPVTWVNVDGLGSADVIGQLGRHFRIHPLSLEDVLNVHQRAKVEESEGLLFVVARMPTNHDAIDTEQISLFLGANFLLTFQERVGDCLEPVRQRIRRAATPIRTQRADYLAYSILDAVIDSYFPILEQLISRLEAIETHVIQRITRDSITDLHHVQRDLLVLRRAIGPHRDAIQGLMRHRGQLISDNTYVHLQDCLDHTLQILDLVDTYEQLSNQVMQVEFASASVRMNEVMRTLTVVSTLFIPLTFIAGVYGMNFRLEASPWNMPELNWRYGYPLVMTVMLGVATGMLAFFYRKGWLGRYSRKATAPQTPSRSTPAS